MKSKYIIAAFSALLLSASVVSATDFREILKLQKRGIHNRASLMYTGLSKEVRSSEPEGYAILCDMEMNLDAYKMRMEEYIAENPHSVLVPQLLLRHALNLFDAQDYLAAADVFAEIPAAQLNDCQLDEYMFKKAYCELEKGDADRAILMFQEMRNRPKTDFTAPAYYSIAYINYQKGNIDEALAWFEKSASDKRFAEISEYYMMECHFILKNYKYLTRNASKVYELVLGERKPYLARIISESYLVQGDAENARKYYDLAHDLDESENTREDWFYSGSVLYAVKDYKGAIESYNKMESRTDSIGQIANYHLGYSYIKTWNKVAALDVFKAAVESDYNPAISQDAYLNWAKLAFDINNDNSIFNDYIKKYPNAEKDDQIYNYIAVASLNEHNYDAAIEAYGEVDIMDERMKRNYMKANYLRAEQLIRSGSFNSAIVFLNSARYYSEQLKCNRLNQMTRFWIAESYFRTERYEEARTEYVRLYNESALYNTPESHLITYGIAYTYFKEENYKDAQKWFVKYLEEPTVKYRKEALERTADCCFIEKDYKNAAKYYDILLADYSDVNDVWPYWRSSISYGLIGNIKKKVEILSRVLEAEPTTSYYPEALYELGRSYVMIEDSDSAFNCFRLLSEKVKDSNWIARAYIEMGSLLRNQAKFPEALSYYKKVVEQMPYSDSVEDAMAAIESIYLTMNNPVEYLDYRSRTKLGDLPEERKENMIFDGAEQAYLTDNYEKALVLLNSYLKRYSLGKYAPKAEYYTAESHRILGNYEQACDFYKKVIDRGETSYRKLSLRAFASISYRLEHWENAFSGYEALYEQEDDVLLKREALVGMMRSAFRWRNWSETLDVAELVLKDELFDASVLREASYVKAKSLLATSQRQEALAVMTTLAQDAKDQYGAEASYILILDSFDKGEFTDVENKVFAFAEVGTRHAYWLAKSFIVLGDSYVAMEDIEQAKATYESVRDEYKPTSSDDDVLDLVRNRLSELNEIIALN